MMMMMVMIDYNDHYDDCSDDDDCNDHDDGDDCNDHDCNDDGI
jgi:hypothetical protein